MGFKNKLLESNDGNAAKQFDNLMRKKKNNKTSEKNLSSDEDPEIISKDLKSAFNETLDRSQIDKDESVTLAKICDCTAKVGKSSVEIAAFTRALGVEKGLDVAKYWVEVGKELEGESEKKDSTEPPVDDEQQFVPLPDLNEEKDDSYFYGADPSLFLGDSDLIMDESPLFQNQMQDPEAVREMDYWLNEV